jgi:hypothetical protein
VLSDPQSVTIAPTTYATPTLSGGTTVSLPRTGSSTDSGAFLSADGNVGMVVSHRTGKGRIRDTLRLNHRKVAADPFNSAVNAQYSMSVTLTIDHPAVGYTVAEAKGILDGFTAYLAGVANTKGTQILGGES